MGWKAFKEHFKIEKHIVHVEDGFLCIGSSFVHDIVKINMSSGMIAKNGICSGDNDFLQQYYPAVYNCDNQERFMLLNKPDVFSDLINVYYFENDEIQEDQAEAYGWPNATVTGRLMYDNTTFRNDADAHIYAVGELEARKSFISREIQELKERIVILEAELEKTIAQREILAERLRKAGC